MNNKYENTKQSLEEDQTASEVNFHSKQASSIVNDGKTPRIDESNSHNPANAEGWEINTMTGSKNTSNPPVQESSENRTPNALNTNSLDEEKQDKWQMPEPVFRVSSGKKVEKTASAVTRTNPSVNSPTASETMKTAIDIQLQPAISEKFTFADEEVLPAKINGKTERTVFNAVGILTMILFAAGFLIGVYFLFFR